MLFTCFQALPLLIFNTAIPKSTIRVSSSKGQAGTADVNIPVA